MITPLDLLLTLVATIRDIARGIHRDWLHWVGILLVIGLPLASFASRPFS